MFTASAVLCERPAVAGSAFCAVGAGDSLIALLQQLINHGVDHLLLGLWQRPHHRRKLCSRRFRVQRDRVVLEDATLAFQQPFDIYAVLLGEVGNLMVFELQDWPDLFVGEIARCGYVPDCRIASLNSRRCAIASLLERRTGCAAINAKSSAIARSIRSGFTLV